MKKVFVVMLLLISASMLFPAEKLELGVFSPITAKFS